MYSDRRRRFLEAMGPDSVALILGARLVTRSADTHFPFRQDSDFHYLTGFDHPHAAAVLRSGAEPTYLLFVEPRDPLAETWTGYRPGVEGARSEYGADEAHPSEELPERLPKLIEGAERVFHQLGRDRDLDQRLAETLDSLRGRSSSIAPPDIVVDPRGILHEMRLHKEPAELEIMRRAADITRAGHEAAARLARDGVFEYELAAALEYAFRRLGASGPAYGSIVGGGRNATVLHYVTNDQKLQQGDLVLVDAGCELEGYASDVTRTYPVGGRMEGERRALYEAVLHAQQAALEIVRPGITLEDVHQTALRHLVEAMLEVGLLTGSVDEVIAEERFRRYYMHRTSHWLGLDVHDVGAYRRDGEPRPLEPGMVFTIEPGIYVSADDTEANPRFRGIGVRIEDDVVVAADGHENLTAAIPKHPADVEACVRGE